MVVIRIIDKMSGNNCSDQAFSVSLNVLNKHTAHSTYRLTFGDFSLWWCNFIACLLCFWFRMCWILSLIIRICIDVRERVSDT